MTRRRDDVPSALAGERLDRVVALATDLTRAQVQRLVAGRGVMVDGSIETRPGRRLAAGQVLDIDLEEPDDDPGGPAGDPAVEFAVVYEDDWLVVVDKPAGLVVHPGAGTPVATLVNGLLARYPEMAGVGQADRPGIVHRLDKGTSGLMVAARTADAYAVLVEMIAGRRVSRRYLTLVEGALAAERGVIDAPVGRSSRQPTRMAVSAGGRQARTSYLVRKRFPVSGVTLLECSLETGRTHQIRVHLSAIGHPVIGDSQYRRPGQDPSRPRLSRPFLHAFALGFEHPDGSGLREFTSELSADLEIYLSRLS